MRMQTDYYTTRLPNDLMHLFVYLEVTLNGFKSDPTTYRFTEFTCSRF